MNRWILPLSAVVLSVTAPAALAQEIKLTLPKGTNYSVRQKPGSTPTRAKDGKIVVQAIVTQHVLLPPDCYKPTLLRTIVSGLKAPDKKKLLGSFMPVVPDFNTFREEALKPDLDVNDSPTLFAFGDAVYNHQELNRLNKSGKYSITAVMELAQLEKAKDYLFLLDNNNIGTNIPINDVVNFQNLGRWYVDEYAVQAPELQNLRRMYGVRIEWDMEAHIDTKNPQEFPVLKAIEPDLEGKDSGQVTPEVKPKEGAPAFDFSGVLGLGAAAGLASPGVEPMIGWAASERSDGLIAGLNLRFKSGSRLSDYTTTDRYGLFLGRTQGSTSNPSFTVLAPSFKVGPNSVVFFGWRIGGSFRNNGQGKTSQGLAVGAAVRFGVNGVTAEDKDAKAEANAEATKLAALKLTGADKQPSFDCTVDSLTAVVFDRNTYWLGLEKNNFVETIDTDAIKKTRQAEASLAMALANKIKLENAVKTAETALATAKENRSKATEKEAQAAADADVKQKETALKTAQDSVTTALATVKTATEAKAVADRAFPWVLWLNREKIDTLVQKLDLKNKVEKWNGKAFKEIKLGELVSEPGAIYRVSLKDES